MKQMMVLPLYKVQKEWAILMQLIGLVIGLVILALAGKYVVLQMELKIIH